MAPLGDQGAAVDHQCLAGDEGAAGAGQEQGRSRHLVGLAGPAQRGVLHAPRHKCGVGHQLASELCADEARCNRVGADTK